MFKNTQTFYVEVSGDGAGVASVPRLVAIIMIGYLRADS